MIKSAHHFRLENESKVLKRFQDHAPLRPLIDEIEDSSNPPALVLQYLDDDVLRASTIKRLTRPEITYVIRRVVEAVKALHDEGFVHTGMRVLNGF